MSFPVYRRLKASGIDWLGDIPEHWEIRRLKHVGKAIIGLTYQPSQVTDAGSGTLVLRSSNIQNRRIALNDTVYVDAPIPPHLVTREGDILICSRNGSRALIGKNARIDSASGGHTFGAFTTVFRSRINDYLFHVFNSDFFEQQSGLFLTSTINQLTVGHLNSFTVPLPPFGEREVIAAFLDRETAKIDALMDEQKRLIALLKEKRQAVISHAVTNGLDPNAPMKDSGVEWLGQVPEHWEVKPLKHLTAAGRDIMYGIVLPGPNVETGVPIVKGGDVKEHRLRLDLLNRTTHEIEEPFARARLRHNDIVYSIRGTIGDAELVPEELLDANITQDVARISPSAEYDHRWLLYVVKSRPVFVQLEQRSLGAAVRGINIFDLKRAKVPVPSRSTQSAIAKFLDGETGRLDAMSAEARSAIELLQERRSALISAAVTGKIDVRGLATEIAEAAA